MPASPVPDQRTSFLAHLSQSSLLYFSEQSRLPCNEFYINNQKPFYRIHYYSYAPSPTVFLNYEYMSCSEFCYSVTQISALIVIFHKL